VDGVYDVVLTVNNTLGYSKSASLQIFANNQPPQVKIVEPYDIYRYDMAETVQFGAVVTDESSSEKLIYHWHVNLVHNK
jgi:hypothetical protein